MKRGHLKETLTEAFQRLTSSDPREREDAVYRIYAENAVLEHPLMVVTDSNNIIKAYQTWTALVNDSCQVKSVLIDQQQVVIIAQHDVQLRAFPLLRIPVTIVSRLELHNTLQSTVRISKQIDNVSISDSVAQLPGVGWFVNNYLRPAAFLGWSALGTAISRQAEAAASVGSRVNGMADMVSPTLLGSVAAPYIDWAKCRLGLDADASQPASPRPEQSAQ